MYHNDILKLKDRQKGLPMVITMHDGTKFIDGLPGNVIIFDQGSEMCHAFRTSNSPHASETTRYEMVSFKYENILHIRTTLSRIEMKEVLDTLVADAVIDASKVNEIMDSVIINN